MAALIWDMDDTLYARNVPFAQACEETFGEHKYMENGQEKILDYHVFYDTFSKYGNKVFEASMDGSMSVEDMRVYRITKALQDYQKEISRESALEFQANYEKFQHSISLTEDLEMVMQNCVKKYSKMGIITNGLADHQKTKYDALNMSRYIPEQHLLSSGEAGFNKPDIRIFQMAEKRWELIPEETWYIGDSYGHDIEGAKAAGWNTIWLDWKKKSKTDPKAYPQADYIVYSITELNKLLFTL